jgi:hypothetical protein
MVRRLFATDDDFATTTLRLVLDVVVFAHGPQKMLILEALVFLRAGR